MRLQVTKVYGLDAKLALDLGGASFVAGRYLLVVLSAVLALLPTFLQFVSNGSTLLCDSARATFRMETICRSHFHFNTNSAQLIELKSLITGLNQSY